MKLEVNSNFIERAIMKRIIICCAAAMMLLTGNGCGRMTTKSGAKLFNPNPTRLLNVPAGY